MNFKEYYNTIDKENINEIFGLAAALGAATRKRTGGNTPPQQQQSHDSVYTLDELMTNLRKLGFRETDRITIKKLLPGMHKKIGDRVVKRSLIGNKYIITPAVYF